MKGREIYPRGALLDVGCRDRKQTNFVGIDNRLHPGVDIVHDLEKFPYPIKANSCITIKAHHIIEHIKPWLTIRFMNELWRMLLPGGQLAISAPYANSPGYLQDPTHCTSITEVTFQYFDPNFPIYHHYRPKPWQIEHNAYKPNGNIEAILKKLPGNTCVELANQAISFGAMQKPEELNAFFMYIKDRPLKAVMEIGTAQGGVFSALLKLANEKAKVISIDIPEGPFGDGHSLADEQLMRTFAKPSQQIKFIRSSSHEETTLKKAVKFLGGEKLDLLFIDGDHTYEGVKKDWEMYSPLVKKGGLVAFHDICYHPAYTDCQVERLWEEIRLNYEVEEFINANDIVWGGIGVITYEKAHNARK